MTALETVSNEPEAVERRAWYGTWSGQAALTLLVFAAVLAGNSSTLAEERALVIYTPTAPYSSNQEFLGLGTPTANPEPSTWILMSALGLLLCVPQVRFRVRSLALARS